MKDTMELCNTIVTAVMKRAREIGPCTFSRINKIMMTSHVNKSKEAWKKSDT